MPLARLLMFVLSIILAIFNWFVKRWYIVVPLILVSMCLCGCGGEARGSTTGHDITVDCSAMVGYDGILLYDGSVMHAQCTGTDQPAIEVLLTYHDATLFTCWCE